jgi:hypothetical protein
MSEVGWSPDQRALLIDQTSVLRFLDVGERTRLHITSR